MNLIKHFISPSLFSKPDKLLVTAIAEDIYQLDILKQQSSIIN